MTKDCRLSSDTAFLLAGHIASALSVLLLSVGSLLRVLRRDGELPEKPITDPQFAPSASPSVRSVGGRGYFDRATL